VHVARSWTADCAAIVHEAESRVGNELRAFTKAHPAPTTTVAPPKTSCASVSECRLSFRLEAVYNQRHETIA
jgi:hypothetical protein